MRPRSYLYVPGDSERKLQSAAGSPADALFIDLEDAVAPTRKDEARALVSRMLAAPGTFGDRQVWVRVGLGAELADDLGALAGLRALHGLVLAKTESADEVAAVSEQLSVLGNDETVLMPLLESANAVLDARSIAAAPRVECLQIGEADLRGDVGFIPGEDEVELAFARSTVVFASVAAGIAPPVGPASTNFTDMEAFRASCERVHRLGFGGRACIHPRQVEVVHDVLAPSADQVQAARNLVDRFEAHNESGEGVMLDEDGHMVDLAVVRQARRLLGQASSSDS